MDSRTRERPLSPDAVEFVRFCHRRRRVGWPELYDEMCAVAHRGLYRGWGVDDLSAQGIGFSLFQLPALAAVVGQVVAEEQEVRVSRATVTPVRPTAVERGAAADAEGADRRPERQPAHQLDRQPDRSAEPADPPAALRFASATAGA